MQEKYNKYLPIGTIISVKNSEQKFMIIGYCTTANDNLEKIYDYNGCLYPVGVISTNQTFLFDHNQIDKLYFLGFKNEEYEDLNQLLYSNDNMVNSEQTSKKNK